ncbi:MULTISPECIES: N-acetyltransferase [Brevibacterium]|uniref:N-acetyltransferase n=1 Tax=Brevibacterium aurantiacum TaxID=273384 RepID=A0A4Z0KMU9_BREAU|nr:MULTISPECIES: N-acetyltransferase [Brevibacterium]TGD38881.1 N-acetyltransferase [Brevibacterium aurantiacum]
MKLRFSTLQTRPELLRELLNMENTWPEFIRQDPIGELYYNADILLQLAEYTLLALDDHDAIIAKVHSIPFQTPPNGELPADGWDGAIRRGLIRLLTGSTPNAISALEIAVRSDARGQGVSAQALEAARVNARRLGFSQLLAPVRPNGKVDPFQDMQAYVHRTREDGLPLDPWLRTHVRAGGTVESIAQRSMVVTGTLSEWRAWTGLPFDTSGPVHVPDALAPVHCDAELGIATYVEPNIWVSHSTEG